MPAEGVEEKLLRKIDSYRDEMLDFAKMLIATPTENPPGSGYEGCASIISEKLQEIGFEKARYGNCILAWYGTGKKAFYLHGHYDTVPAYGPEQFEPYVKDRRLYGRGSTDMKAGLAAIVYAAKAVKECEIQLGGRICLTIVPDEETAGTGGSNYLFGKKLLGRDGIGMVTPEFSSGAIWNANRGAISLRLVVRGKAAHVGLHYQGVNAFEGMITAAEAFLELKKEVERRTTGFEIQPEAAKRSILLVGGLVQGGKNFNVVPAECSFTLDRRINPEEDIEAEKERMMSVVEKLRKSGIDLRVEMIQEGWSASSPQDSSVARVLSESINRVEGKSLPFELCPGLLETRFYAVQGIPAYSYGPGLASVAHGPEEYVMVDDVIKCCKVYALTATRLLAADDQNSR